nr:hypothetical protein Itr_chr13CG14400 [Ipomoea trifida]GMC54504.1 hypothetical protein Iba_chr01dCG16690 [Ipomoea batatas]GMC56810.1 hypothetical protein Iba_scaffold31105CG0110 [Ipomoea batatas]GMD28207.1 hypothetical protein Iba_chr08eCG5150 [Ipomoea batatas]GMD82441.1 hypothetical protein Iba_chr13fCG8120 [Ipomoea batatas]
MLRVGSVNCLANATPCSTSDHQLYALIPRWGMAGTAFTSPLEREAGDRSLSRRRRETSGWQKRKVLVGGSEESQENGGGAEWAKLWSLMVDD